MKIFQAFVASWLMSVAVLAAGSSPQTPPTSRATQPTPQTPAAQPQTPAAPDDPGGYLVGRRDRLHINVSPDIDELNRFSKDYPVGPDGNINFPELGAVKVDGLTARQIEALIRQDLVDSHRLTSPSVDVQITDYASKSVTVMGEVRNPGDKFIKGNEMTLSHAIGEAGGFTADAGPDIIVIHSTRGSTAVVNENDPSVEKKTYSRVSLLDTTLDDPPVRAGDTISVPKAETFDITGEVRSGGRKIWQPGMTVLDAVGLAGGLNDRASMGRSYIQRKDVKAKNGYVPIKDLHDNTLVLPNDQIIVEKKFF